MTSVFFLAISNQLKLISEMKNKGLSVRLRREKVIITALRVLVRLVVSYFLDKRLNDLVHGRPFAGLRNPAPPDDRGNRTCDLGCIFILVLVFR